jgi:DNA invertase Pin-like site-specific DNA recombinase
LIDAARRGEIDAVLVWRLDRWGRSLADLVTTLKEPVEVGSCRPPKRWTCPLPPVSPWLAVFARSAYWGELQYAEFERNLLPERVCSGLAEARYRANDLAALTVGLHAGPVRKLYRAGLSKAEIARRLNLPRTSVRRILAADTSAK